MQQVTVALQLYTVRDETARDFVGTIRRVAELGYQGFEGGSGALPAEEMKSLLGETGLQMVASHLRLTGLRTDLDRQLDYCRVVDCPAIVLSWLDPEERSDLQALVEQLNTAGERCLRQGVTLAYHNHDFEFERRDGVPLLDRLMEATDPARVGLELDVYWAAYAGADPVEYLRRYAGRIPLVHLKDMAPDRSFADVGDGVLDMRAICRAAIEAGTRYVVVENDQPRLPSPESARRSLLNLTALGIPELAAGGAY